MNHCYLYYTRNVVKCKSFFVKFCIPGALRYLLFIAPIFYVACSSKRNLNRAAGEDAFGLTARWLGRVCNLPDKLEFIFLT